MFQFKKSQMPKPEDALPGREQAIVVSAPHSVLGASLTDYPADTHTAVFGMGCFWGVERLFWQQEGVFTTAVGYAAGYTNNPTYEEVCTGLTGHNEVVKVVYWPDKITYKRLLELFWNSHNPTQGMRQGNDTGTQYRSGIYYVNEHQKNEALESKITYQKQLAAHTSSANTAEITTEVAPMTQWYFAEPYHQQYLAKNPHGYCNMQTADKTGLPTLC